MGVQWQGITQRGGKLFKRALAVLGSLVGVALLVFAFMPSGGRTDLQLSFTGMPALANGFYYEGWVVVDGEPWSTGRFNVAADGSLVTPEGNPVKGGVYQADIDMTEAAAVAITLHPPGDDRGPNAQHIVGGAVEALAAKLTLDDSLGIGANLRESTGTYSLTGERSATLTFATPGMHPGFAYEAWVVKDGVLTSLGTFGGKPVDVAAGGHVHVHQQTDHTLKTHELVVDGADLRGSRVVLTLEPIPDDAPEPFGITVLDGDVVASAEVGVGYDIPAASSALPLGKATVQ